MASASSSTSIPPQPPTSYTHDVFLCFRGPDTGNGFTNHLYAALERKGIRTFKDDKYLRIGVDFPDGLVKAIEESMFAIIVFSPDFASSSWCLDEVCKIMECQNKLGLQRVEVFYHVEPSDVRHQIGTFQKAFEKHKQDGFHESEKIQRWRKALEQVTNHNGWTSKKHPDEAALVENIAQHIFELLIQKLPSSTRDLVGIKSRVGKVISQIGLEFNDVCYIGIWGMGGIGKTTLARAVFEAIRSRFDLSCFVADVRQHFEKQDIIGAQKQLLKQMNVISSDSDYNKYDGSKIIQTSFRLKKVLIVLDDVSHENELHYLAKEKDWFGPGSRVIITTRNKEVLKQQEGHKTYEVKGLVNNEALNLFCSNAFKRPEPIEGFSKLSNDVVEYSGGLPLALKVLGSYLNGRPIAIWESAIEKIKKSSYSEIIDVLRISYDSLDSMEKNIFLDIACFFKGREKDKVTEILERCGHDAKIGIDILINRSLVTLEETRDKRVLVGMHDLLEEMGKQIVKQESPDDPSKRSRLWCDEDILSVIEKKQKIEATHGIVLYHKMGWESTLDSRNLDIRHLSFSNICQLKLLILDGVKTPILNIPSTLKVFKWRNCPMETLPFADDQRYELVEIDLFESEIVRLWDGKKFLNKLEHLNLDYCEKLKETPDLSGAPNLKTLRLLDCYQLNYIHPSLAHHKGLVRMVLWNCNSLETLGDKLQMSSLKQLRLSGCRSLIRLPEFGECMKQLSFLTLHGLTQMESSACDCSGNPLSHGCFDGLKKLEISGCSKFSCILYNTHGLESLKVFSWPESESIATLLRPLSHLTSLTSLSFLACFGTSEEPTPYYNLAHLVLLTTLDLSFNRFSRVPLSFHQLPRLKRLELTGCSKLEVLPELPSSLRILDAQGCNSLGASHVNDVISKACCLFAESSTQDPQDFLQMWISGKEIPAWFDHQGKDYGVSISFPNKCPSTETLALALCFQFEAPSTRDKDMSATVTCNGKKFINKSLSKIMGFGDPCLGVVCVKDYYLSKLSRKRNHFQLLTPLRVVQRCGARWVYRQDIPHCKESNAELHGLAAEAHELCGELRRASARACAGWFCRRGAASSGVVRMCGAVVRRLRVSVSYFSLR